MKKIILAAAIAALASGCASQNVPGIGITSATPVSVTVWGKSQTPLLTGPARVSDQEITTLAENHCQKYGKHARRSIQRHVQNGGGGASWRELTFDCIRG